MTIFQTLFKVETVLLPYYCLQFPVVLSCLVRVCKLFGDVHKLPMERTARNWRMALSLRFSQAINGQLRTSYSLLSGQALPSCMRMFQNWSLEPQLEDTDRGPVRLEDWILFCWKSCNSFISIAILSKYFIAHVTNHFICMCFPFLWLSGYHACNYGNIIWYPSVSIYSFFNLLII